MLSIKVWTHLFLNPRNDVSKIVIENEGSTGLDHEASTFRLPWETAEAGVQASSHYHAYVLITSKETALRTNVSGEIHQSNPSKGVVADKSWRDRVNLIELEVQIKQVCVVGEQVIADWRQIVGFQVQSPEVNQRVERIGRDVVDLVVDEPNVIQGRESYKGVLLDFVNVVVEGTEIFKPRLTSQRIVLNFGDVVAV